MQDYPVAIDNCLVFDEFGDFIHKARVQSFYPNVYCVENIDDILEVSNAIMVARGDLGVEVPLQALPFYQKTIIRKCRFYI